MRSDRNKKGYIIEKHIGSSWLIVTGPWSTEVEDALIRGEADWLELNRARGFSEPDLEFLSDRLPVRRLNVVEPGYRDLTPIARLSRTLDTLVIGDGRIIDLSLFPKLETLAAHWRLVRSSLTQARRLQNLRLWGYPGTDLAFFGQLEKLASLELVEARSLKSLTGIRELRTLTVLRIFYARALGDISAIALAGERMCELEFQNCPRLTTLSGIENLVNLRRLGVNECGTIESLRPLQELRNLEILYAWGTTKVVDNDLAPIAELPRLTELRMQDRRGYRPRVSEIEGRLSGTGQA